MNGEFGALSGNLFGVQFSLCLGDSLALSIFDENEVTDGKIALCVCNVRGEQVCAGFGNGGFSVCTDGEGAAGFVLNGDPAFFGLHRLAVGGEVGTFLLPVEDGIEEGFVLSAADDDSTAGAKGDLGGGEFADHAADGGGLAGAFGHRFDLGSDFLNEWNDFSGALFIDQAGDIGEDKELVGAHHAGDQGGEGVVIAELNLCGADRIVLVDDGYDAAGEEALDGIEYGVVPVFRAEVFAGQKDLGNRQLMGIESALPVVDQDALPDGGAGL